MGPRKDKGKGKMVEVPAKRKREARNPSRSLVIREPQQDNVPRTEAQAQSPSAIAYPEVEFTSDAQRAKFEKFMKHKVIPSKFFEHETLRTLGLFDGIRDLCDELCMLRLFNMCYNPVPRLCYEFFSSFEELRGNDGLPLLRFRLMNQDVQLSFDEFCRLFGMASTPAFVDRHALITASEFWFRLTGEENVNTSRMNISHVQHPVYRLMLKWLGACVLGKTDYHLTRKVDVLILSQIQQRYTYSNKRVPLAIINNFKSTAEKEKHIACGGLITHIAATLPQLGYVYNEVIRDSSLMNISYLINARDIGVSDRSAPGSKMYKWILHPPADYKDKGEITLPLRGELDNLMGREHYCLRGALPESILRKFGPGNSSDSEEGSEEGESSGHEGEGEGEREGEGGGEAGINDVEMAEAGPSSEMEEIMGFVQSRAPSPRVSMPPSATASHPPPQPPSPQSLSHTIPLTTSRHSIPRTIPLTTQQMSTPNAASYPSHHNQPQSQTLPIPSHQTAAQPGFEDLRAYIDQKFDALLAGQQSILAQMEHIKLVSEQNFENVLHNQQVLYNDHSSLLHSIADIEDKVNYMWDSVHEWPQYDDGNWSPWTEPGQTRPADDNYVGSWHYRFYDHDAPRDDANVASQPPNVDASNVAGPSGANQELGWGNNSDDSFHPPDDWY